ncbi:MAG: peptide MFS transporter [Gemmatimonadaceae bacterium]|nr:peptide MFS transporter [Gemmatimonadaceae bacterium]
MSAATPSPSPVAERSAALDDRSFFGHPRGLGLLFAAEMWERFSYYGMRALLVLYLVNELGWEKARATGLYGTYTMLVFLTPIVGGFLADRLIGTRRSLVLGGAIIAAGHFVLAFPGMTAFYAGLGLVIVGTGLFKPNVSTMVGQLYPANDTRRDAGFTFFYMGINLGAFLGPLVCGYLAASPQFGWHWGFAAAGVGMVLGLIAFVVWRDRLLPGIGLPTPRALASAGTESSGANMNPMHGIVGVLGGVALAWLVADGSPLALLVGAIIGGAFGASFLGTVGEERMRVIALFIVAFFVVFFWAAYEQQGSSFALFFDRSTNRQMGSFEIPSAWSQSINPFFVLAFSPVMAWVWLRLGAMRREPSTSLKMVLGLALLGAGFMVLQVGGALADGGVKVSPAWLVVAIGLQSIGEVCVSPVGLSYVTKVAPAQFASLLMGVWFLSNAAANKVSGFLAGFTPLPGEAPATPGTGLVGWIQEMSATNKGFFTIFVISSFAAAALMFLCVPLLKRLTRTVQA